MRRVLLEWSLCAYLWQMDWYIQRAMRIVDSTKLYHVAYFLWFSMRGGHPSEAEDWHIDLWFLLFNAATLRSSHMH